MLFISVPSNNLIKHHFTHTVAMAAPDMTMKLLIDTKAHRVLYAEAGKDVVDFLFTILSLPLGSVTRFITSSNEMVGSLGNLYHSIEDLRDTYMLPKKNKDMILNPVLASPGPADAPLLLPSNHQPSTSKTIYRCTRGYPNSFGYTGSCVPYVSFNYGELCPSCDCPMTSTATIAGPVDEGPPSFEGGFVLGLVPYMIMDDLVVKPLSTTSSIALLNALGVNEVGSLKEKVVNLSMDEGKKLLKASLQSKTVLTDVFFEEKASLEEKISLESIE